MAKTFNWLFFLLLIASVVGCESSSNQEAPPPQNAVAAVEAIRDSLESLGIRGQEKSFDFFGFTEDRNGKTEYRNAYKGLEGVQNYWNPEGYSEEQLALVDAAASCDHLELGFLDGYRGLGPVCEPADFALLQLNQIVDPEDGDNTRRRIAYAISHLNHQVDLHTTRKLSVKQAGVLVEAYDIVLMTISIGFPEELLEFYGWNRGGLLREVEQVYERIAAAEASESDTELTAVMQRYQRVRGGYPYDFPEPYLEMVPYLRLISEKGTEAELEKGWVLAFVSAVLRSYRNAAVE